MEHEFTELGYNDLVWCDEHQQVEQFTGLLKNDIVHPNWCRESHPPGAPHVGTPPASEFLRQVLMMEVELMTAPHRRRWRLQWPLVRI